MRALSLIGSEKDKNAFPLIMRIPHIPTPDPQLITSVSSGDLELALV